MVENGRRHDHNTERFGPYDSRVINPREHILITNRKNPGIAKSDVDIQELLVSAYSLHRADFFAIFKKYGVNPNNVTTLVDDIQNGRFPTRIKMSIREVRVNGSAYYVAAMHPFDDTDLPERIAQNSQPK